MITRSRHNDLLFETDRRGLLVCVDSVRNVLGVCCVELAVMLSGAGRPLRQDDVFSLSQELAVRAMVLHGQQLHCVPLGGRVRLHPHGALHRPLHRHRLPAQAQNVQGQSYSQKLRAKPMT